MMEYVIVGDGSNRKIKQRENRGRERQKGHGSFIREKGQVLTVQNRDTERWSVAAFITIDPVHDDQADQS